LHRFRYRQIGRNSYQHMHMISIDRSCIDCHLLTMRYLPQQLTTSVPHISCQNLVPVFCRPHKVVLTIPNRVATLFVILHLRSITRGPGSVIRRLKARGLRIPYRGL
jgi:hypothetical protein